MALAFRGLFGALALLVASMYRLSEPQVKPLLLDEDETKMLVEEYAMWHECLPPDLGKGVDLVVDKIVPWISFPVALSRVTMTKMRHIDAIRHRIERYQPNVRIVDERSRGRGNGQPTEAAPYVDPGLMS